MEGERDYSLLTPQAIGLLNKIFIKKDVVPNLRENRCKRLSSNRYAFLRVYDYAIIMHLQYFENGRRFNNDYSEGRIVR